ncbi:single-stranded DNA-binding protein [Dubosiella newyorkensis]|uniref:single-stranded DNA-binding protein n=1 Tax=Dubosiella newyorkensis TaxID=1862672 RepID=UPI00272E26FE|nr:single-stranded DNA-binding protein [Dubosiella newyorkensis]
MINNVILVGRLTKDIEIRQTTSGSKTTSFALAVNRTSKKEGQPDADFINCVAWNKTAELMAQYLRKGSLIGIEGRIQTRSYDNQQGQKVYVTEVLVNMIQFLGSRNANLEQNSLNQGNIQQTYQSQNSAPKNQQERHHSYSQPKFSYASGNIDYGAEIDIQSDDLPF